MSRGIASLTMTNNTTAQDPGGTRGILQCVSTSGTLGTFNNDPTQMTITSGATSKITVLQDGVYRVTGIVAWESKTTGKTVRMDLAQNTTEIPGTLLSWVSLTGQMFQSFALEAIVVGRKNDYFSIYLSGDADATDVAAEVTLTVERVDI